MRRVRMVFLVLGVAVAGPVMAEPLNCEPFDKPAERRQCDGANRGDLDAMVILAERLDGRAAVSLYRQLAGAGDPRGLFGLAQLYRDGNVLPPDQRTALKLLHAAAEQGLVAAERELAQIYERGQETDLDVVEAARWYARAAAHGDPVAQLKLAQVAPAN